jgi:F420-dependent oxidoreductase-like protein
VWTPQLPWEQDLVVTLAVALREVEGIEVGTGVLPIQSRVPMVLAQQALTLNLLSGGRLKLGIGLTHTMVCDGMWGIPWDRPVRRLNEYLDGLLPLLAGDEAKATGETTSTRGTVTVPGTTPPPVYVAALRAPVAPSGGPEDRGDAHRLHRTETLKTHTVPTLQDAAAEAHRSAEVIACLPVCLTDDPASARQFVAEALSLYGTLPSYEAMLAREGVDGPADVALIGDEDAVSAQLDAVRDAGVDEFSAWILCPEREDEERTRAFLREHR